jgi:pimeloyl-ACP methyl ester carboxylesterase
MDRVPYEEFSFLSENAADFGIPFSEQPAVERVGSRLADGRIISAIQWGTTTPEVVFFHGGAQNAHTWDTTMLALQLPSLCVDLPGHGHSGPPNVANHDVIGNAEDLAVAIPDLAPHADTLVAMSLGGLTAVALLATHSLTFKRLILVDITPRPNPEAAQAIINFLDGPSSFESFDEILERTMAHNPTRTEASLRRGILHNAVQRDDGSWVWRHLRSGQPDIVIDSDALWLLAEQIQIPVLLCRGMKQGSVVTDESEAEFMARILNGRVQHFPNGGHSLQGDSPLELAAAIKEFRDATA